MQTTINGSLNSVNLTPFAKGSVDKLNYPLTSIPSKSSKLHSPMIGKPHGLTDVITGNEKELIDEVLEVVGNVARGEFPHWFMKKYYPTQWGEYTGKMPIPLANQLLRIDNPRACAKVVHMDNPIDMPNSVLSYVLKNRATLKVPSTNHFNFINLIPNAVAKMATSIDNSLIKAFEAKYYFGICRPEEMLNANITAYPEGCPNHPSYPAGHGAAAGAGVKAILDHFNLPNELKKEALDSAYFWSMFRTFAGVHYGPDNIAGLKIGGLL